MNISYLSNSMADYLDAPLPYLIGIQRTLWENVKKTNRSVLNEVSVFDADKNSFESVDMGLPEFPQSVVREAYKEISSVLEESASGEREELAWAKKGARIRMTILKFYFKLIGNFSKYYKQKGSLSHRAEKSLSEIFDIANYLKEVQKGSYTFIREFAKSECFITFIESMHNPKTPELLHIHRLVKAIQSNEDVLAGAVREALNAAREVTRALKRSQ